MIVIKRVDGGVSALHLVSESNVLEEIEKWKSVAPGQYISHEEVADDTLPTDRTFRNAWRYDAGRVVVDMPRARNIHRDTLRKLRAPLLVALDVAYQRADELGDAQEKKRVVDKKQALRDVTADPRIDAAATPEDLKVAIPDVLKGQ